MSGQVRPDVVILGAFPPPLGGNSVHIQRLHASLTRRGQSVMVLDYLGVGPDHANTDVVRLRGRIWRKLAGVARVAARTPRGAIVHMHVSAMGRFKWIAPYLVACFRRQPRVLTIHSGSFIRGADRPGLRAYLGWLLRRFHEVIVVNDAQRDFLIRIGLDPRRVHVVPAFLVDESEAAESPLPAGTGTGKTLVVTSGYLTPLYNYDVLIDCAERLPSDRYHFVFAFYHEVNAEYEAHVLRRLAPLPNVTVLRNRTPAEFLALLRQSAIYVRPTLADGDAVAVREALHFGNRVFASSVVERPASCDLFPANDSSALLSLFETDRPRRPGSPAVSDADNVARITGVYRGASEVRGSRGGKNVAGANPAPQTRG